MVPLVFCWPCLRLAFENLLFILCSSCVNPMLILCYSFDFEGVGFGMVSLCVCHPNLSPRSRRVTEFLSPLRVSPGTPWHRP